MHRLHNMNKILKGNKDYSKSSSYLSLKINLTAHKRTNWKIVWQFEIRRLHGVST